MKSEGNSYIVVSPGYPPPLVGGAKVYLFNMLQNCPVNLDILTSSLKEGNQEVSDPRHSIFRKRLIWDSNTTDPGMLDLLVSYTYMLLWFSKRCVSVQYDVIVVNTETFANGLFFVLGRLLRVPTVGIGYGDEFTVVLKGRGFKNLIKRIFMRWTQKRASGFVVVCDFAKEILISLGVEPEKIVVIPPTVSPDKAMAEPKKKTRGSKILSVGRLIERKGFHRLVQVVSRLRNDVSDIRLTIVGNGPWRTKIQSLIAELDLERHVCLTTSASDSELALLYEESDLFVLAHTMLKNGATEGCPTVFVEAMTYGLPVIGGTESGASTAIVHGETGFVIDCGDIDELTARIRELLFNSDLAAKMGKAGQEKVKRQHLPSLTGPAFYKAIKQFEGGIPPSFSDGQVVRSKPTRVQEGPGSG